jgi:DNA-binding NarL/FixJ family response regulator
VGASIVLAEDQNLIRDSLTALLSEGDRFRIVGSASNGIDALDLCRRLKPDLALLDIRMPRMDGLETAQKIREAGLSTKIVLLTTFEERDSVKKAFQLGAEGYLLKDIEQDLFRLALEGILRGLHIYHPRPDRFLEPAKEINRDRKDELGLTARDMQFIELITEGLGNKEIAQRENCSEGTVKNRVSSILNKMGLQARTQIAVYAIKHNLIGDEIR